MKVPKAYYCIATINVNPGVPSGLYTLAIKLYDTEKQPPISKRGGISNHAQERLNQNSRKPVSLTPTSVWARKHMAGSSPCFFLNLSAL